MQAPAIIFIVGCSTGIAVVSIISHICRDAGVKTTGWFHSYLVGLLCVAAIGLGTWYLSTKEQAPKIVIREDTKIRCISETQEQLRNAGFDIDIDGKWGPETDRAYCDYQAKQYFE